MVEEEWSPGEIAVDRTAIKTLGSRSEPRQSGSTTLILDLDRALGPIPVYAKMHRHLTFLRDAKNGIRDRRQVEVE